MISFFWQDIELVLRLTNHLMNYLTNTGFKSILSGVGFINCTNKIKEKPTTKANTMCLALMWGLFFLPIIMTIAEIMKRTPATAQPLIKKVFSTVTLPKTELTMPAISSAALALLLASSAENRGKKSCFIFIFITLKI